ncbi:uncharacterized protein BX663DRAFT_427483 [Cokeromyces recurvatus]|uniref:uncharacterized protein n=1 Tax=Cokeromyces recurvatus TaxID=90255 RepID=UPI00221FF31E|nr:uncharacterized protein BX663DRAFT_427483 [Cokeromyces recurvatus]KAI7906288.1 hypothetical protein BX663DRAFT_427483 [Cokeromyces recurvatus]
MNENYITINQQLGQSIPLQQDQFPTYKEFDSIVQDYLQNLSSKKRDKALINQARYSIILQVLRDPRNTAVSTAQFRFWVKKMFQLNTRQVICHDGKPVAMREQIYSILVRAHTEAHHGGRDKTSALVRRRYSWIPKELIARFVRHCPFCISRRNGTQQSPLFIEERASSSSEEMMMMAAAAASVVAQPVETQQYDFEWPNTATFNNQQQTSQFVKETFNPDSQQHLDNFDIKFNPLITTTFDMLYEAPVVNSHTSPSLSPSSSSTSATSSPIQYNVSENNYFLHSVQQQQQQSTTSHILLSHQLY